MEVEFVHSKTVKNIRSSTRGRCTPSKLERSKTVSLQQIIIKLVSSNVSSDLPGNSTSENMQACNSFDILVESSSSLSQSDTRSHFNEVHNEAEIEEEIENDYSENRHEEEYIEAMMKSRKQIFQRSFRFINVAILSSCIIAGLLRPMEEKQRRRSEPRSFYVGFTGGGHRSNEGHAPWSPSGLYARDHHTSQIDAATKNDIGPESHKHSFRRYLGNDDGNDGGNGDDENYQQQVDDVVEADDADDNANVNDDQANANNGDDDQANAANDDVEEEDVEIDDANYYNSTNDTYYQEEEKYYKAQGKRSKSSRFIYYDQFFASL